MSHKYCWPPRNGHCHAITIILWQDPPLSGESGLKPRNIYRELIKRLKNGYILTTTTLINFPATYSTSLGSDLWTKRISRKCQINSGLFTIFFIFSVMIQKGNPITYIDSFIRFGEFNLRLGI